MLQDVNRYRRKARKRQKPNEARWKKEQTKDLLKAAEDARDKIRMARGSGAHTETLLCSYRFNVFVLQKFFFFCFTAQESLIGLCCFIKIYMFWTYVDILQMILWYKNMNIYNHQPPSYNTPTPRPHIKKEKRKVKAFNKIERHTIFLHNITARTAVQLSIHSKQSLSK